MPEIAKKIIDLNNVKASFNDQDNILELSYKDNKISLNIEKSITIKIEDKKLYTSYENLEHKAICGTINRNIANFVCGLETPFKKLLKLEGTGYKGKIENNEMIMNLGYSHPIHVKIPENITAKFTTPAQIELQSICKQSVSNFAQVLTKTRPYNPYSGKGVLRSDRTYTRKETKRK